MFKILKEEKESLISECEQILDDLFPLSRSLTGDGVRATLRKLNEVTSFEIKDFKSGEKHYDWEIPKEWFIKEAFIKDSKGKTILNYKNNNLHVVNYSNPVNTTISYEQLNDRVYTLPNLEDAIPYRTAYYSDEWGFCMSHNDFKKLDKNETYNVLIDSEFKDGVLNYGEVFLRGRNPKKTFIFSTYCCHPSLANDNLSGIVLWILLLRELKKHTLENNYIFVIHPETIGAIAYLQANEEIMTNIEAGSVITTVAGPGKYSIKRSCKPASIIDRACIQTFKEHGFDFIEYNFDPDAGSDERQYSSQYFGIPMISICRDKYFEYDFYHTSKDDLNFISAKNLIGTLNLYLSTISKLEKNFKYKSLNPKCEPMLGKRGLYPSVGGQIKQQANKEKNNHEWDRVLPAINWLMYLSNGENSLLDIAEITSLEFDLISDTADLLKDNKLLERI